MSRSYEQAVAGWTDHLRSGGTSTWSAWRGHEDAGSATPTHPLPDAPHLELVRRLNLGGSRAGLRELVLRTPSPGRGAVDVPLAWPEAPRRFGTPAVEPEALPEEELIRLAVGVLARLLPGLPPVPVEPGEGRWPLPWRRRFRVHGTPGTAAGVRRLLLERGAVETDWRATNLVVARPVEVMMAEHWAAAARAGGILKWSTLWRRAVAADRLPGDLDVPAVADGLPGRLSSGTVHVVVARDAQHVAATVAHVLGVREGTMPSSGSLAETDLLRRLNRLLALTEGPERVRGLTARLLRGVLTEQPPSGLGEAELPVVPAPARAWAEATAAAMADRLRGAGYPVHGDPGALAPSETPQHTGVVDRTRTLELALAACLGAWQQQEGNR